MAGCSVDKSASVKQIEFWTLQLSDFAPYINRIIVEYEKTHPDVKIKWVDVPFSEGEKRALVAVMSKEVPDLINMNPSFASTLASRGALVNLKPLIGKEDFDSYLKESWDASAYGDDYFGIPWYITSSVTLYNTAILKKAGLNSGKPPRTFEDMKKISEVIKKRSGKYAFMPNLTENGKMVQIFSRYDIPIVNQDRTKAVFNTKKASEVLDFWKYLYRKDLIPPEALTEGHRASLEKYLSGENAFIFAGANFLKIIKENAPEVYKYTKAAPQITGSNGKVDFALMNLVIPLKSKHPKEAADFGLFLTNAENQLEFSKLAPVLPSNKVALNSPFFKSRKNSDEMQKARALSANQLKRAQKPVPPLPNNKELFEIIDYATQDALLNNKDSKEVLDNAVKEWDKILLN